MKKIIKNNAMYKVTADDWEGMKCNKVKFSIRNTKVNNAKMMEIAEKYAIKNRKTPITLRKDDAGVS